MVDTLATPGDCFRLAAVNQVWRFNGRRVRDLMLVVSREPVITSN